MTPNYLDNILEMTIKGVFRTMSNISNIELFAKKLNNYMLFVCQSTKYISADVDINLQNIYFKKFHMVEVQFHIKISPCGTNFTWSKLSFISKILLVEQITWITLEEFRCWYYQPY